jgi:hypothetical protein
VKLGKKTAEGVDEVIEESIESIEERFRSMKEGSGMTLVFYCSDTMIDFAILWKFSLDSIGV